MEIIPAIDLRGGRCVRLFQGQFDQETEFSDDPCAVARRWEAEGAKRLHVVDLDGAKEGIPGNLELVARIVRSVSIPVQLGGGLRSEEAVGEALAAGVTRAIIGPAALEKDAAALLNEFGERLIVSVDARDGRIAKRGWQEITDLPVVEFAKQLESLGARRLMFTDIGRDGAMKGPNFAQIEELVRAVSLPIIAAGGVTTVEDVRRLVTTGAEAAIIGRALYVGTITLKEAIAAC